MHVFPVRSTSNPRLQLHLYVLNMFSHTPFWQMSGSRAHSFISNTQTERESLLIGCVKFSHIFTVMCFVFGLVPLPSVVVPGPWLQRAENSAGKHKPITNTHKQIHTHKYTTHTRKHSYWFSENSKHMCRGQTQKGHKNTSRAFISDVFLTFKTLMVLIKVLTS